MQKSNQMMKMKVFAILPILLILLGMFGIVSANYLVHLTYDNGKVTQDAVYYIDSATYESDEGEMNVTVGDYESALSFPLMVMHDYTNISESDTRQQVEFVTKAEAYVVVPEVPAGTNIVVSNGTDTLLNEPIKKAVDLEPKIITTPTNKTTTSTNKTTTTTDNETGAQPPAACFPVIAVPTTGALAYLFGKKKGKK
jgi:hypothetical protein